MPQWIDVAQASEVETGKGKVVRVLGRSLALFRVGGEFCAIDNVCPHQGGPLGEGDLEGEVVECPWHAWRYNVRTGCPVLTPNVATFAVRKQGDALQIAVSDEELAGHEETELGAPDPIHEILTKIGASNTLDDVVDSIYSGLQPVVPHNRLGIALLDESSGKLVQVKTRSDRKILLDDGFSAHIEGSSLALLLESGQPRILDDLEDHLAGRPSLWTRLMVEEGMRSSLTLPLKVEGQPIGVVFFASAAPRAFSESHVGFLKQVAGQLSVLIEKGRWLSELAQTNERYRILFEMSDEGIFVCPSPEERFVTVNENLCAWLGYSFEELSARTLRDLMRPEAYQEVARLFEDGSATFETELLKKGGAPLPVQTRALAFEHRGRRLIQGFVRDLSEIKALSEQLRREHSFEDLIGKNPRMQEIYELIRQVAPMATTVLIQGESGTGKELVARAIHQNSPRRDKRFVAVNCGALVESLLESELFGHVKGAFTGATTTRAGRFEAADGGTIFLDEIAELRPATQVKLLRVLQQGEFEKVGSAATQKVDVRVIAATNRDLKKAIQAGTFREDLYYRLNVVPIDMPPLRERREDVPLLVRHLVERFNRQTHKSIEKVSPQALEVLLEYRYPGNVRELENIIEHAFVKCQGNAIEKRHLPPELASPKEDIVARALLADDPLAALEKELVRRVLAECRGEVQGAAKRLGISRITLWRKLRAGRPDQKS